MTSETKVGVFTVLGILLIGISVYMLGNFSFSRGYKLKVRFADVSGLPVKSAVRLNGVEVGTVKNIKLEGTQVVVILSIHDDAVIYRDSVFKIAATSLIGSKFLRIDQGNAASGAFKPGDYADGVTVPPMDEMIAQTMTTVNNLVTSLNQNGSFGKNINATLSNMRQLTSNMNELITSLKPYLTQSADNFTQVSDQLKGLVARADDITKSLQDEDGAIGALLKDKQMKDDIITSVTNLKQVSADAKELIGKANRFRMFWDVDGYYDTSSKLGMFDTGLKIFSPNNYTYYRVGVANVGNRDNIPKSDNFTEVNQLDARLGIYNNYIDVSAGLVRGAGGGEVAVTPFYGTNFLNRFTFRVLGTDWGRNRVINNRKFTKADVWYGADFKINRFFTVGGGMLDVMELNHPYAKVSFTLQDKDIAAFFGLATLAR